MKLSDLVRFRKRLLDEINIDDAEDSITEIIYDIETIKQGTPTLSGEYLDYLESAKEFYRDLKQRLSIPLDQRKVIVKDIEKGIENITKGYMARGYMINGFYAANATDANTERQDRVFTIREETKKEIISRISLYSDWRYPGLEIGPGDGIWTEHLVACDPLYIADMHQEFLDSTMAKFTPEYQRRMRPYHIDRFATHDYDLSKLPRNQIGFVFAWNVFNYFPYENLKRYLKEIYEVVRPGGVVLFSYNDGENPVSIEYVETGWMSYVPKTLLKAMVEEVGFKVIDTFDRENNVSWIEIKKPGTLETIKAHQVLGKISDLKTRTNY